MITLRQPLTTIPFPYTTLFRSQTATRGHYALNLVEVINNGCGHQLFSLNLACRAPTVASGTRSSNFPSCLAISLIDRKSTRLNSSHEWISYAVFCLKKKKS